MFLALIPAIAIIFLYPMRETVSFRFENTEELLAYLQIQDAESFSIKYTHSIHLSDVIETYELKDHSIIQQQLSYEDFAVGMPSNAEGDETFEERDGRYIIGNMNRVFPFIDLRIGQVRANHTVIYQEKEYPLKESIQPGTWVRIQFERLSLWEQLRGVKIND
ncbi:DUF1850 domain-containing protein [Bacillus lacus]|uniref:DUF1850 domain-containing protein n=2 Tax=Metabacillus lacus TaxID=1983721 RepID=A0A7X2J2L4_9BACI|nr:DUF1850 domain-containing protein [Metabacillus lacus]